MTLFSTQMVFKSIGMLFNGEASIKDLSGPVGIVQIATFQLSENFLSFINLLAFISITLGIMNLFPIPVLDGGHLVLLIFECIFRRPVSERFVQVINNTFAIILIALTIVVLANDILLWTDWIDMLEQLNSND